MIKKTLSTYYGEKRDLETLDYQLMSSKQGGESLEKYFDKVNRTLSLIANFICTNERFSHPEAAKAMIYTYNRKAIDAFIRGLDGDIGRFLKNYEPESLAHAYSYCISFQNIEFRKSINNLKIPEAQTRPRNSIPSLPPKPSHLPRIPMRPPPNFYNPPVLYQSRPPFNIPQQRHFQNYPPYPPPPPQHQRQQFRPTPPVLQRNPYKAPDPIDTDVSMRTANVNYANRPNSSNQKPPLKRPRLFHAGTYQQPDTEDPVSERTDYVQSDDEEYYPENTQTFERYLRAVEAHEENNMLPELVEEEAELNFLE